MTFPTLLFYTLMLLVFIVMGIAMGNERLLSIAPAAVWGWMCVLIVVICPVFVGVSLYRIFTTEATPDAPRLPNVGQGIKRLLFPAPPVARRQHTTRARSAQTTTAKPERVI